MQSADRLLTWRDLAALNSNVDTDSSVDQSMTVKSAKLTFRPFGNVFSTVTRSLGVV